MAARAIAFGRIIEEREAARLARARIPAIIIPPLAKKGTVDHTQYDTASVQRLINRRFGLTPLPGITARDDALEAVSGGQAMGDLTDALNL